LNDFIKKMKQTLREKENETNNSKSKNRSTDYPDEIERKRAFHGAGADYTEMT